MKLAPQKRKEQHHFRRRSADAISTPGKAIEKDASRFAGTVELWRSMPGPARRRRTPLGRRLEEIRERIVASGDPLLSSWEEVDRELGERRDEDRADRDS